jgi:hypothetical protein
MDLLEPAQEWEQVQVWVQEQAQEQERVQAVAYMCNFLGRHYLQVRAQEQTLNLH